MRLLLVTVLTACFSLAPVRAEIMGPGEYTGWIVRDRWGETHLANGQYLLRLEKTVMGKVRRFLGKSVRVDASRIGKDGFDDGTIAEVRTVAEETPAYGGKLEVSLMAGADRMKVGTAQRLEVRLDYSGDDPIEIRLRHFEIVIRRRGPPLAEKVLTGIVGKDDDGTKWISGGVSMLALDAARLHENRHVFRAPGGILKARGTFRYSTALRVRLPAGEYEAWAIFGDANFSKAPDARSAFTRFDVEK